MENEVTGLILIADCKTRAVDCIFAAYTDGQAPHKCSFATTEIAY